LKQFERRLGIQLYPRDPSREQHHQQDRIHDIQGSWWTDHQISLDSPQVQVHVSTTGVANEMLKLLKKSGLVKTIHFFFQATKKKEKK